MQSAEDDQKSHSLRMGMLSLDEDLTSSRVFLQDFLLQQEVHAFVIRSHPLASRSQVRQAESLASCHHRSSSCRGEDANLLKGDVCARVFLPPGIAERDALADLMSLLSHLASSSKKAADRMMSP